MKKVTIILLSILSISLGRSQVNDAWVYFEDKPDSLYYLTNPEKMLSKRALNRRSRYGIRLDIRDVPVDKNYLTSIGNVPGIQVAGFSKWMNAVHVQGDSTIIAGLLNLDFVSHIEFANKTFLSRSVSTDNISKFFENYRTVSFDYGNDTVPYVLHNAYGLHAEGWTGKGVLIAVIDAGFPSADTSRVLQHIYARNGVVDTYNFPDDTSYVYTRHPHGTIVWSVIGGKEEGNLIGTAPDADFCLYISEDVYQEMPVEETYWVMAAERADSVGVDVINTSLGYIYFDNPLYNHTWDDLDGQTAFASRGAKIAVEKGMHVIISAGNAGNSSWQKISVPADAKGVVAVGAVDRNGIRTYFSSRGNSADGRIKPDVMSWGLGVKSFYAGNYISVSGTSLSAPLITGFTADVVQAFPSVNPGRMKDYLLQASDRFQNPDSLYGYGIPDFGFMFERMENDFNDQLNAVSVYPNPFSAYVNIEGLLRPVQYRLFSLHGQEIQYGTTSGWIRFDKLSAGIYFLILSQNNRKKIFKLMKQP